MRRVIVAAWASMASSMAATRYGAPDLASRAADAVALPGPAAPRRGPRDARPGLSGLDADALAAWLAERGQAAYRLRQIAHGLWSGRARSFDELRVLPAHLRADLAASFRFSTLAADIVTPADGGLTERALHKLDDGLAIESVLMRYPAVGPRRARATVCISSQAGCAVGCPFCATGELGLWRDLDVAEIVDQVLFWSARLRAEGQRVTNVVFMGMGEPLLNTAAVLEAAAAISDPDRYGLGARHLTISTSGVLPGMERLTGLAPQYTLAVSLHAARPALRQLLVPLEQRWSAVEVVAAAARYARATGRRITYEFVMIDGINDTGADAQAAADLIRGQLAHINLIPMNEVAHTPWRASPAARIDAFAGILRGAGISTTIRRNRGMEIGAACGQLAGVWAATPAPAVVSRRRETLVARSAAALRAAGSAEPAPP